MKLIKLQFCEIEFIEWGCRVTFQDGTQASAIPHPDDHHYRVIAHRTGYGDDVLAYCQEHELAHCLVEERFHSRPSRVLWALAHGSMLSGKDAAYEEITAQTFQRFLRANERPIVGGLRWDELKRDALAFLA